MTAKSCKTCGYSAFERTPTGRVKRGYTSHCSAPFPDQPIMPASMTVKFFRTSVSPEDGINCPDYVPSAPCVEGRAL